MRHTRNCDEPHTRRAPALMGCMLVMAALALPGHLALGALGAKATPTPTLPATAVPGTAPTFAIKAPLFGVNSNIPEGPVNTYVKVAADPGAGWTPTATITLSVTDSGDCTTATIPVNTGKPVTVANDESFSAVFQWPQAANQGPNYTVCATESGAGTQVGKSKNTFIMLSQTPPSINVSTLSVPLGGTVTVSGTGFLPVGTISLWLQHPNQSFNDDQGDPIPVNNLQSHGDGTFSVSVTLPTDRTSTNVLVATLGKEPYKENGLYPVTAASQPITFLAATPTPQITPTIAATASAGTGGATSTGADSSKLLVGLLGLIAVVLLLAGIIVAVLALRGRTPPPDTAATERRPSGGFGGAYMGDGPMDQTIADAEWQGRNWQEDDPWQSPPGRPWSGARVGDPRGAPPQRNPMDDDEDDRFRTRMGDPYQSAPPPPPQARPNYPPQSRPMGPPTSRPMPPRSNPRPPTPNWNGNDTNGQGQGQGQDTGPAPWPPRQ